MGIEPTREALPDLENKGFVATTNPKCDGRVNIRGVWGHVGLRRDTSVDEIRGSSLPGAGLLPGKNSHSSAQQDFRSRVRGGAGNLSVDHSDLG
jgi:hypothetical protein